MISKHTTVKNMEEVRAFATEFLMQIESDSIGATVIGLRGDLGAGKTSFTKICADLLGISDNVTSPTFVLLKKYKLAGKIFGEKFSFLIHIDAYRLKGEKELETIGWQEIISDPKNLIMIEWPEIVEEAMPVNTIYVDFKHVDETTREITI